MATNLNDSGNWREKYLSALDEQDKLEKKYASQQQLLRSALVRVSLAADGQDELLDTIMEKLREKLRTDISGADTTSLLSQLEQATLNFEQQRENSTLSVRQSLAETARALRSFDLSRAIKKEIDSYLKQLPQRSKKVHLYPALLQQLAGIQQQALKEIEQPKTGFFDRLLQRKNTDNSNLPITSAEKHIDTEKVESLQSAPVVAAELKPRLKHSQVQSEAKEKSNFSFEILRVLNQFLSSLENEESVKEKAGMLRQQLSADITQEKLIPTLESVRDLVMEAYLTANDAFATYLKNVNQELAEIYEVISGAVKTNETQREASRQLHDQVIQQMTSLASTTDTATDLNELKHQVKSQIDHIRQAIDQYQQAETPQLSLAEQLHSLSQRIKTMEEDAEKNRSSLEEQRHKALHDALTELPNREAYNERAKIEVQRWQRYGRPLSIAIVDIDHFKKINDTYGHAAGDRVIKVIGRSIAKRLREVDFFCRYGGEEFVALLPETDGNSALHVLDKIRNAIATAEFNYKEHPLTINVSIGITQFVETDRLDTAFERADQALYEAKSKGRNNCKLF
jgi:diguanylate cyclase